MLEALAQAAAPTDAVRGTSAWTCRRRSRPPCSRPSLRSPGRDPTRGSSNTTWPSPRRRSAWETARERHPAGTAARRTAGPSPRLLQARPARGHGVRDGDLVRIVTREGRPCGYGFWHGRSLISVRVLTYDPDVVPDESWLRERVRSAVACVATCSASPSGPNAWRVVHAEGDGLSGLVVDRYGGPGSVALFSLGWQKRLRGVEDRARRGGRAGGPRGPGRRQGRHPRGPLPAGARGARRDRDPRGRPAAHRGSDRWTQDRLLPRPARQPAPSGVDGQGPDRLRRHDVHGRLRARGRAVPARRPSARWTSTRSRSSAPSRTPG